MPPLHVPNNKSRRKGVTPIKKPDQDHVWQRTLNIMGLESISSSSASQHDSPVLDEAGDGLMAAPTATPELTQASKKKLTLLDLPAETKKNIIRYSSPTDLLALCLVSKDIRDLAAEQLYRKFEVIFPDDPDDGLNGSPDALAGGLETLVSSAYDYSQYLKHIVLESTNNGDKGERAYRYYMYDSSCGKFMNTLFLLALRKARGLESFKWDIRVELSRSVFKALHQIPALQHLHLRMQPGHSTYTTPSSTNSHYPEPPPVIYVPPPTTAPPPGFGVPSHHSPSPYVTYPTPNSFTAGYKYAAKLQHKTTKSVLPAVKRGEPTLSGFKGLKALSILDMDTLDYVAELRTCICNSSPTLKSLTLSFSEILASKARNPPPEVHSEDESEVEDEFGQLIPPPGPPPPGMAPPGSDLSHLNATTKTLRAQEERRKQEDTLYRIFGMKSAKKSKSTASPETNAMGPSKPKLDEDQDPKLRFLRTLGPIAKNLMSEVKPGSESTPQAKKALELIIEAANLYVDEIDKSKSKDKPSSNGNSSKGTPSTTSADTASEDNVVMSGGAEPDDEPGLFDNDGPKKKDPEYDDPEVVNPEDFDIEEPEGKELVLEFDAPSDDVLQETQDESQDSTDLNEPIEAEAPVDTSNAEPQQLTSDASDLINRLQIRERLRELVATHQDISQEGARLKERMQDLRESIKGKEVPSAADLEVLTQTEAEYQQVGARVDELNRSMDAMNEVLDDVAADVESMPLSRNSENKDEKMSEYVRSTRGLTLDSLAIYLIPVRSTVMKTAIDVRVLQSLTLLNVGAQVGIWRMLQDENAFQPLPLSKIYSDNVTTQLLQCVGALDKVTELMLLERQKGRVESLAMKTTVKIEKIRQDILKKHAGTLKVLMIKHDSSTDWDLDIKTVLLLCRRAKQLEELSASFDHRTLHALIQFMPGLPSLHAIHISQFHTDDRCPWVTRETKKFIVDSVAHNPLMKLEYIALGESIERLVRRFRAKKNVDKKGKGKAKAKAVESSKSMADLLFGPDPVADLQPSSDDDADMLNFIGKFGLKIETIEGIRFSDITGVRIFEKDVLGGRL